MKVSLNFVIASEDVVPTTPASPSCPGGWSHFNGYCYKLNQDTKSWGDAEAACQSEGGHLASIHSEDENDFLVGKNVFPIFLMKSDNLLGLHAEVDSGCSAFNHIWITKKENSHLSGRIQARRITHDCIKRQIKKNGEIVELCILLKIHHASI